MDAVHWFEEKAKDALMELVDYGMSAVPRAKPETNKIRRTQIIAHRGSCNSGKTENTLEAFDEAIDAGVWSVEFDVRFTKDNVAVIHHDKNCLRTFGADLVIAETPFDDLRKLVPKIPTLKETVAHLKGRTHLMVEIKKSEKPLNREQTNEVGYALSALEPVRDYHFMSLDPRGLLKSALAPNNALLAVAEFDLGTLSRLVLQEKMAGFTAHYALLTQGIIDRHLSAGQKLGTGFISSRSVFYREVTRGIEWIYTNDAAKVTAIKRDSEQRSEHL